jgi:ubiquinone/menaquinone biosynthesis C-methylase UbiE
VNDPTETPSVAIHYARHGVLTEKILAVLEAAGHDRDALTLEDLKPLDHFHNRGQEATKELAALLELAPDCKVVDIGCGIGGPARWIAAAHGCFVEGIDLTQTYVETAKELTTLLGLDKISRFTQADACALPFADRAFDAAISQHAAMNIADKAALYGEIARVVKPGGRFALYDVVQGPATGSADFPLPWASDPACSFLLGAPEIKERVEAAGFTARHWADRTTEARAAGRARRAVMEAVRRKERPPPLSPASYLGPEIALMLDNMLLGLEAGQLALVQGVFERKALA